MAVIKTLKGQTVVTVICNIVYPDPPPIPPPDPHQDKLAHHMHKMASAWRVLAFFLIVFVVPVILIALPLYARYNLYPARSLALVAADTFDLHKMVSTFWCQGQRVSSNGTFDAYLLPEAPKLSKQRRKVSTVSSVFHISELEPEAKMVHLLEGSSFTLAVCARWPGGTVIVVKGEENFKRCFYQEDIDPEDAKMLPDMKHRHMVLNHAKQKIKDYTGAPPTRTTESARSPPVKNVLPFDDDDLISDLGNRGGEIFDDTGDLSAPMIFSGLAHDDNDGHGAETTTIRLLDTSSTNFRTPEEKNEVRYSTKVDLPERKQYANELYEEVLSSNIIDGEQSENDSLLMRAIRSILTKPDPADGSDEKLKREEEKARKLSLLHSVNDTRDVTAGNSSMSSSEEFMQHCDNFILSIDVTSLIDCQVRDIGEEPKWSYRINETNDYYFIFMSDNSLEENVMNYYLQLERTMYDISENTSVCGNKTECTFPFGFLGSEAVVVEMTEQKNSDAEQVLSELSTYEMQAVCQPRVAVYMVFILMVPFIILLFAFQ